MLEQEQVTVLAECPECKGTGLYTGWTCHDGAAMVCQCCEGSGSIEISYVPFTGRKKKEGIKRIFKTTSWIHVFPEKHTFGDGLTIDFSQFGCTVEEWENGTTPKPIPKN